jgi:hypothetical protein
MGVIPMSILAAHLIARAAVARTKATHLANSAKKIVQTDLILIAQEIGQTADQKIGVPKHVMIGAAIDPKIAVMIADRAVLAAHLKSPRQLAPIGGITDATKVISAQKLSRR